ncbi:S1C family serine protease [Streptomyces sp. NBC_00083]|uniref:S1C family serine protease n=1 Tax=Streptomyces sp. NBC_00083 TaxID=2975647 RepID=UPI0022578489|nr:trypsin-like peptidase domain-containing protein [Streptomyces sp. NBC_00083]MCX5387654.1 trypsin-like peptidase domain-containing protein [Streptomyces sp. NBC_00083]
MSTENEGTAVPAVPPAPSSAPAAPPAPAEAPARADAPAPAAAPARPDAAHGDAERTLVHDPVPPTAGADRGPAQDPATAPLPATPGAPAPQAYAAHESAPPQQGGAGWPPPPPVLPSYGGGGGGNPGDPWGAPQPPAPRRRGGGLIAAVVAAALVAGGIGGAIGYFAADRDNGGSGSTTVASSDTPKDFKRDPGTVAGVAASSLPSVVTIDAQGSDGEGGTGTGFIYDKEGHILTNNHVVASAASGGKLSATFSNGKKYDAEVVGRAQGYDVAVIKLKNAPSNLKPLSLGNSDKVAVGDSTIAIGAPFGLSNTVTTGIISAKNRPVASSDGQNSKASYMSALQTDASINPGNSGGPLINSAGAVIGINSAIQSAGTGGMGGQSQAGSIGLGFAIPINEAKNVAEQLIKTGQPVYPVIGASVGIQQGGGLAPGGGTDGAQISQQGSGSQQPITPGGPADKAGLKPGDVITKFGDMPIDSGPTLISEIWTHQPGDQVPLTYTRNGKETTVTITLGERKGDSN